MYGGKNMTKALELAINGIYELEDKTKKEIGLREKNLTQTEEDFKKLKEMTDIQKDVNEMWTKHISDIKSREYLKNLPSLKIKIDGKEVEVDCESAFKLFKYAQLLSSVQTGDISIERDIENQKVMIEAYKKQLELMTPVFRTVDKICADLCIKRVKKNDGLNVGTTGTGSNK